MFCSLNRWLGFPQRIFCTTEFAFKNLVNLYEGKAPIFMSVARYEEKNEPYMDKFPFDFDSDLSLRIPYKETSKLLDFSCAKDIPHRIMGSGRKGFHFYFGFEEEAADDMLYSKIFSIQHSLKKYFKLQAVDTPLFGKKALLIRVPTTKYVSYKTENNKLRIINNGNYCRYIPDDEFRKGLDRIEELMKSPGEMPKNPSTRMKIDDIIDLIPEYKFKEKTDGFFDLDLEPAGVLTPSIKAVGLPCLQKIALNRHPTHYERIELVAWLKIQNYRDMAINAFIKKLKWHDYNYKETAENVASIKPRFPKCTWLRERYPSLCEKCSLRKRK